MKYTMTYVFKIYLLLFIIVLILPVRECSTFLYPNATHPDHVGKCYLPGPPPKLISVGQIRRESKFCAQLYCDKSFNVHGASCPTAQGPAPCRTIPGDPSKPFPHCCPEIIC